MGRCWREEVWTGSKHTSKVCMKLWESCAQRGIRAFGSQRFGAHRFRSHRAGINRRRSHVAATKGCRADRSAWRDTRGWQRQLRVRGGRAWRDGARGGRGPRPGDRAPRHTRQHRRVALSHHLWRGRVPVRLNRLSFTAEQGCGIWGRGPTHAPPAPQSPARRAHRRADPPSSR